MALRLPLALRTVHFEPLDAVPDQPGHSRARQDTSNFTDRVEKLANEYLRGRPLFIQTASLRGPFDDAWAESNPWAPKHSRNQKSSAQQPRVSSKENASKSKIEQERLCSLPNDVARSESPVDGQEERERTRACKRKRTTKDDSPRCSSKQPSIEVVTDSMYMSRNADVVYAAEDRLSKLVPPAEDAVRVARHTPSTAGEEDATTEAHSKTKIISTSAGSSVRMLRGSLPTPSDSGEATPRSEIKEMTIREHSRDALKDSTRHVNNRDSMSQPFPQTSIFGVDVNEQLMPSTLPALDSIKANERRHDRTMQKIFPRPIKELERSVADWAFQVKEQSKDVQDNCLQPQLIPGIQNPLSRHHQANHAKHIEHLNAGGKSKRFMTFDTPPIPLLRPTAKGRRSSETVGLQERTNDVDEPPAPLDRRTRSVIDSIEAIDCHTNTVMSPAEAVRVRRAARDSAVAWSTFSGGADCNTSNTATKVSSYICTQAAMEQAYEAFQEGLLSPVKEARPQTPPVKAMEAQITPFSRSATPPLDGVRAADEEAFVSTQDLFDAAPIFSADSAGRTTFAPRPSSERDNVKENQEVDATDHSSGTIHTSSILGTSSCVNPRSILKKDNAQAPQVQPIGSPDIDVDSFLDEATSFLEPFNIDAELYKTRQDILVPSQ